MIRDRLYSQIAIKIREPLDTEAFERAAFALLEPSYATLVPVSGGQDAGQDGVTAGPDPIMLVSTTGLEFERNFARSLASHIANGGVSRRAIFATSQPLNRAARDRLKDVAQDASFELIQAYGEDWFIAALHQDSFWRKELLDITGDAPALSTVPPSIWSAVQCPLVGRGPDLERLRATAGDGILAGVPGVGKSAVLRQLVEEDWGLFLAADDPRETANDIRELNPPRIIVDDAQFAPDRLIALRRLREEMRADFAIVAVTWMGSHQLEVQARLPGAWVHTLEELIRDEIVEILRSIGLGSASDNLLRVLVNQARGRPGLAVTLASLVIGGNIQDVATGDAMLSQVTVISKRLTGADPGNVLGILALGGDVGVDLETTAEILQIPLDTAQRIMNGLASGGMISETSTGSRRLVILPEELRFPIVRQVFFAGSASLDVRKLLPQLPQPGAAVVPLVGASHRGASVPDDLLQYALGSAPDLRSWEAYAAMGEVQARKAMEARPDDSVALAVVAINGSPEFCIGVILDAAAQGRKANPMAESPFAEMKKWMNSEEGDIVSKRLLLAGVTTTWAAAGGSVEVALDAYATALDPEYERISTDPGAGRTVSINRGHLLVPGLERLRPIWDEVIQLLASRECHDYRGLIRAIGDWCYPGRMSRGEVDDKVQQFTRPVVGQIVSEIAKNVPHRALAAKLSDLCENAEIEAPAIDVDPEFLILFPRDPYGRRGANGTPRGYELAMKESKEAAENYADTLLDLPREEAMAKLSSAVKEAMEVENADFQYAMTAAMRLAEKCEGPPDYVFAGINQHMDANLLFPFLRQAARLPDVAPAVLERAMDVPEYCRVVTAVALIEDVSEEMTARALENLDAGLVTQLWGHIYRGEVGDKTLIRLLRHHDHALAWQIADGLFMAGNELSADVDAAWRKAVTQAPIGERHSTIFEARLDLLESWIAEAIERRRSKEGRGYDYVGDDMRVLIAKLPLEARRAFLHTISGEKEHGFDDFIPGLVGTDVELVEMVFATPGFVYYYGGKLLEGDPAEADWLRNAEIALAHGWDPRDIVRHVGHGLLSGPETAHCQAIIDKFSALSKGTPSQRSISVAGIEYFTRERDEAGRRERRWQVDGR